MLFSVLSQTLELMKTGAKPLLRLSFFVLMIPSLLFGVYFRVSSHSVVTALRELTTKMAENERAVDYTALLELVQPFLLIYFPIALLFLALFVAMYVASTLLALENLKYYKIKYSGLRELFLKSLKLSFPKAYIILFVAFFVGGQFGLMQIFGMLLLMSLNLMLVERKGAFSSLWQSLTFKYASLQLGLRFRVFASIGVVVVVLFYLNVAVLLLSHWFLNLDQIFVSLGSWWSYRPGFLPCSVVSMLVDGFYFLYALLVFFFLSNYLSCLYVSTSKKPSERK